MVPIIRPQSQYLLNSNIIICSNYYTALSLGCASCFSVRIVRSVLSYVSRTERHGDFKVGGNTLRCACNRNTHFGQKGQSSRSHGQVELSNSRRIVSRHSQAMMLHRPTNARKLWAKQVLHCLRRGRYTHIVAASASYRFSLLRILVALAISSMILHLPLPCKSFVLLSKLHTPKLHS